MIEIPSIALGAICAALIAGMVSLLGLIISKEQKTSEFRQVWIDQLRSDLSNYLTSVNSIVDKSSINYRDQAAKIKAMSECYSTLNSSTYNIVLRLNAKEKKSKAVLECIARMHEVVMGDGSELIPDVVRGIETDLLISSQKLLKSEWNRVKRGEITFVISKLIAAAIVISAAVFGILFMTNFSKGLDSNSTSATKYQKSVETVGSEIRRSQEPFLTPPSSPPTPPPRPSHPPAPGQTP